MSLVEVKGLTKKFGTKTVVDNLSFALTQGRCMALLGPNGAGKTTTLKMLSGLLQPTSGAIQLLDGKQQDLRQSIGYLPQYPAFFNWMTGREFLQFTGKLARMSAKEATSRTDELLELVDLKSAAKRRIGGYSGGMKQRIGLAQAVIHRPKLLILDEPVSALDPQGRRSVMELLQQLKRETTILFSTHVLHDAEEVSDDVLILDQGRVVIEGELKQLMRQHQKPQITIRAEQFGDGWIERLRQQPYVQELQQSQHTITIQVSSIQEARPQLLEALLAEGIEVERFEVGHSTLEDLFMKAVQG